MRLRRSSAALLALLALCCNVRIASSTALRLRGTAGGIVAEHPAEQRHSWSHSKGQQTSPPPSDSRKAWGSGEGDHQHSSGDHASYGGSSVKDLQSRSQSDGGAGKDDDAPHHSSDRKSDRHQHTLQPSGVPEHDGSVSERSDTRRAGGNAGGDSGGSHRSVNPHALTSAEQSREAADSQRERTQQQHSKHRFTEDKAETLQRNPFGGLADKANGAVGGLADKAKGAVGGLADKAKGALNDLKGKATDMLNNIKDKATGLLDAVKAAVPDLSKNPFSGWFPKLSGLLGKVANTLKSALANGMSGLGGWAGLKSWVKLKGWGKRETPFSDKREWNRKLTRAQMVSSVHGVLDNSKNIDQIKVPIQFNSDTEEITKPHEGSAGSYSDQMSQMQNLAYFGQDGEQHHSSNDPG